MNKNKLISPDIVNIATNTDINERNDEVEK